jgi:hypothetical protein
MGKDQKSFGTNVVKVNFKRRIDLACDKPSSKKNEELNEKKREIFAHWLGSGIVSVLFDARVLGVSVPMEFSGQGDLRLDFCYQFYVPDFNFNEEAVWGTLSFDSGEFFCQVPWISVYSLQSAKLSQGAVWFEYFPKDYDQIEVLGFNEEMCEDLSTLEASKDESKSLTLNNVVSLDFSGRRKS